MVEMPHFEQLRIGCRHPRHYASAAHARDFAPEPMEAADENRLFLSVMTLGEIRQGVAALPQSKKRTRLETWLEIDLQSRFGGRFCD